jgi:hypothetical protein
VKLNKKKCQDSLHIGSKSNIRHPEYEVGSLFNNAFSVTRLYSTDDRMISERLRIGKDLVGTGHGLILRHLPGGTEQNHENPQSR